MDNRLNNRSFRVARFEIVVLIEFVLLTTAITCEGQQGLIPDKYLRLVPGVSTRVDVENLLGKRDSKGYFVKYQTSEFSVGVAYSLGPCELGLGVWGFPEWTVEEVFYDWPEGTRMRLRDIILAPKRFEKRQIGDVIGDDYYVNDEFGISVVFQQTSKSVDGIRIRPSAKLIDEYACDKTSSDTRQRLKY